MSTAIYKVWFKEPQKDIPNHKYLPHLAIPIFVFYSEPRIILYLQQMFG